MCASLPAGLLASARQKKQELVNSLKWRRRPDQVPANNMRRQSYTRRDNASSSSLTNTTASQAGLACNA